MKQAYQRRYDNIYWESYYKIEVLPKCRRVTEFNATREYQLVRRKLLGFIPYTYWLLKKDIKWFDHPSEEYYDCEGE